MSDLSLQWWKNSSEFLSNLLIHINFEDYLYCHTSITMKQHLILDKKAKQEQKQKNFFSVFLLFVISLSRIYLWLLLLHCLLTSSVYRVQESAELGKCTVIFNPVKHYMFIWHVVQQIYTGVMTFCPDTCSKFSSKFNLRCRANN